MTSDTNLEYLGTSEEYHEKPSKRTASLQTFQTQSRSAAHFTGIFGIIYVDYCTIWCEIKLTHLKGKTEGKGEVKCTLVQALKLCTGRTAHRGSRDIAVLLGKAKVHPCTGTKALYRPYGP